MLNFLRRPLNPKVASALDSLLESQFWPADRIQSYQWTQLKKLLQHASTKVPYYTTLFHTSGFSVEDIRTPTDFARIPFLNKENIQTSTECMMAIGTDKSQLTLNSTGGSTGMPLNFYQDRNYEVWADAARCRAWRYMPGGDLGSLEAVLWGAIRDVGKGFPTIQTYREILRDGVLQLNTFDLDETVLHKYLRWFNRCRPSLLRGYASSLYYVANFIDAHKIKVHQPSSIISSTEILHPRMRHQVEKVFGAPVFDSYGCREVSQIGTECSQHDGFHIVFENQYVEVVNQEIIVTNLNNYAMPFIRYRVGDLASSLTWAPCICGRHSARLTKLLGRDNDNIELANGKVVNGEFFEFLFFGMSDVVQYQISYSRSEQKMTVRLQLANGGSEEEACQAIRRNMNEKFHFSNIEIIRTAEFDKTPTGKLRFVSMTD